MLIGLVPLFSNAGDELVWDESTGQQLCLDHPDISDHKALGENGPISVRLGSIFQLSKNNINSFI